MKKRILIAALAACVLLSFAGCSSSTETATSGSEIQIDTSSANGSDSTIVSSFDDPSVTAQEPDDAVLYFTEYVYGAFQTFSASSVSDFSVSELHTTDFEEEYGTTLNVFNLTFSDPSIRCSASAEDWTKSYTIIFSDLSEENVGASSNALAAAIYAAYPALTPEQAISEAENLASTLSPTRAAFSTESRQYGNCEIQMTCDADYQGYTIFSEHTSD